MPKIIRRDAVTGRFVSEDYVTENPTTTIVERRKSPSIKAELASIIAFMEECVTWSGPKDALHCFLDEEYNEIMLRLKALIDKGD